MNPRKVIPKWASGMIQYHNVPEKHGFCSLAHFLFPCAISVRFGTFLELDSTPSTRSTIITTTTKLLIGPLSVAYGKKMTK